MKSFTEKIKTLISADLPGEKARLCMTPDVRGVNLTGFGLRKASVLILLYPDDEGMNTLLIRRTTGYGPHSGQVSLPGGMWASTDRDEEDTALRETEEETGINKRDITILGKLTNLLIPVSNAEVSPFVGYIDYKPMFNPDPLEVEYLIEINLKTLLNPEILRKEEMLLSGRPVNVPYYLLKGEKVWGATAMILAEFIDLLTKAVQDPHVRY